jgi:hypothetical protein
MGHLKALAISLRSVTGRFRMVARQVDLNKASEILVPLCQDKGGVSRLARRELFRCLTPSLRALPIYLWIPTIRHSLFGIPYATVGILCRAVAFSIWNPVAH